MQLAAGERVKVDTGCLVALDPTIDYDIIRVGGVKTALFGGEGLFSASLTGPGRVWLQTLPFLRLADRIHQAYRGDRDEVKRDLGGTIGRIGDLIGATERRAHRRPAACFLLRWSFLRGRRAPPCGD